LGTGVATVTVIAFLDSCAKSDLKVDFTLDLTQPKYSALNNPGGSVVESGVIVARDFGNAFHAVSVTCTHAGCDVTYESQQNEFYCPCHGSLFNSSGDVLQGPATTSLQKFNVDVSGSMVHVYS